METKVWEYITKQGLIREGQVVGAAVSGGPDSMALLVCLCSLGEVHGFDVKCVHFEHGIRGEESLADAEFVEDFCAERDIPMFVGAADVPALARKWGVSEETAAKRAREEYMDSLVLAGEADVIATGHHLDDSAESVLMHILRGSGLSGLTGIHSRYGNYIRPFLCTDRSDILAYVAENDIAYVTDATNADNKYIRNYVRNVLMPGIAAHINPDVSGALNRLSSLAARDSEYIEEQASSALRSIAKKEGDTVRLCAEALAKMHPAIAGRVVRGACALLHVHQDIEMAHITAVIELAKNGRTGAMANISRNICAELEYGSLLLGFTGRRADSSFEAVLDINDLLRLKNGDWVECREVGHCDMSNADAFTECFDLDKLPAKIAVRTRHVGDVIHPLGAGGGKKLKDYFIDKKLPREERERTPLLAEGSEIIWAVGHVMSDLYKVDGGTERILEIKYIKKA